MRVPGIHALRAATLAALVALSSPLSAQEPRLYYERDGNGSTVVLVEEWAHDTSSWFLLLPSLRQGHRLIRYDLRGQGRSEAAPDGDYSIDAHLRDLERLLDGLDVSTAHLVGLGIGGRIALEATRTRPDRVRSLTLIQPRLGVGPEDLEWWARLATAWERVGEPSFGEYSSVLVQRWIGSPFATSNRWVPPFYDLMLRRQDAGPLAASLRAWIAAEPPGGSVVRGVPVLVVVGEDGPPPGATLSELVPTAGRLRIPDRRWPIIDAAREIVGPLGEFLSGVDARMEAEQDTRTGEGP